MTGSRAECSVAEGIFRAMPPRHSTSASIVASLALAAVTLAVFFVLQDYGPESTLRRFHEAILQRDAETVNDVTVGGLKDPPTEQEVSNIYGYLQRGARYRLLGTDHRGRWVGAEVQYIFPSGRTATYYWVIVKRGPQWKVDAEATERLMSMPPQGTLGLG